MNYRVKEFWISWSIHSGIRQSRNELNDKKKEPATAHDRGRMEAGDKQMDGTGSSKVLD